MSVVDDETSEVVAGSWWVVVKPMTAANAAKAEAQAQNLTADPFWLPEGSEIRRYAGMILANSAASKRSKERGYVGASFLATRAL